MTGFINKLRTSVTDETFCKQLVHVGILMEFESLLSCHGDEIGMIEDMAVAVADLSHVSFKIELAANPLTVMPTIEGNR